MNTPSPVDKNIIEKINKLLALATSTNEHESTAAAAKASELLTQYNLSLADLGTDTDQNVNENEVDCTPRYVSWKMILLTGIAEANGCQAIRYQYTGKMSLVGYQTSIIVCQHLYEYLSTSIEHRARYRKGRGRAYLNAFRVGCATRLSQRLLEQREAMEKSGIPGSKDAPPTPAIVVKSLFEKTAKSIADYLENQGLNIKIKDATQISSELGFTAGYQTGDKISLNTQKRQGDTMKRLT